jgi:hypothetical protein
MNDSGTLTFSDIIKNGILEEFSNTLSPTRVILTLLLACAIGLFILLIYKKTFTGVLYSRSFGLSLIMVTLITSLIIMPITSNITLSLGMVGALSIVRFRTAVKDAMDTMFMFWGIAAGICLGANFWEIALVGSLTIGLIMVVITGLKIKTALPFILVLHFHEAASPEVRKLLSKQPSHKLKSKSVRGNTVELTVELRLKDGNDGYVDNFLNIEGVYDASLLSYQGDIVS